MPFRSLFLFIVTVVLFLPPITAAQDDEVIKVNTQLVSVPVIVTDRDGKYVGDLKREDFGVLEDGVVQPLEFFAKVDEPLTLALLIDTSHSTRPVLSDIKDAARSLIKLLRPEDQAMVVTFDRNVTILCELTSDREKLKKAVKDASIPDPIGTVMRDAIYQTAFTSLAGHTGRKAIIVLTDGQDGGSHIGLSPLLLKLQETDTLIYPVQFRTQKNYAMEHMLKTGTISRSDAAQISGKRPTYADRKAEAAAEILKKFALVSAGKFLASDSDKLKQAFEAILNELRLQYRLGFYPSETNNSKDVHEIRIRVARPNLTVRARASYRRNSSE